jgi:hypothetical protein
MAERIGHLPDDLVASFAITDFHQRVSKLQQIGAALSLEMLPVVSWLERRRPADKAEFVKRRLFDSLQEAAQCAQLEIPEYVGGVITRQIGDQAPSAGALRAMKMVVTATALAATLREWADEIEAEDKQRPLSSPATAAVLIGEDVTILRVLSKAGRALRFSEICRESARLVREMGGATARETGVVTLSETKLKERVPILEEQQLVSRPTGPKGIPTMRKGVGITDIGRAWLQNNSPPSR